MAFGRSGIAGLLGSERGAQGPKRPVILRVSLSGGSPPGPGADKRLRAQPVIATASLNA